MASFAGTSPAAQTIRSVAVIGAGEQGRAFALRCAASGLSTVLQDVLSSKLRKVQEQLVLQPGPAGNTLRLSSSIEDAVREADLAIDFVPDELESKLEIFSLLDRMAPPKTIFCTPTQLSISDLASCTYRADRCVALVAAPEAFSSHAQVIEGEKTDQAVIDAVSRWLERLGLAVTIVKDPRVPAPGVV